MSNREFCFPYHDDLLFCLVSEGECVIGRPETEPLQAEDFALIRTVTPFWLASEPAGAVVERNSIAEARDSFVLGTGNGKRLALLGGRFVLETAKDDLLTALLPPLVAVTAAEEKLGECGCCWTLT